MSDQWLLLDASCLIVLYQIDELDFLRSFPNLITTPQVAEEYEIPLPPFIEIKTPKESTFALTAEILDRGEASLIALALDFEKENTLVLDDLKARKYAQSLGLNRIGTLGLIAKAHKEKKIQNGMALIEKIQTTDFRISEKIVEQIRRELDS